MNCGLPYAQIPVYDRTRAANHAMEHEHVLEAVRQRLDENPQAITRRPRLSDVHTWDTTSGIQDGLSEHRWADSRSPILRPSRGGVALFRTMIAPPFLPPTSGF
jgi:hypothetical protein